MDNLFSRIVKYIKSLFTQQKPKRVVTLKEIKKIEESNILIFLPYTNTFIEVRLPNPIEIIGLYDTRRPVQLNAIYSLVVERNSRLTTSLKVFKENLDSRDINIILVSILNYLEKFMEEGGN